MSFAAIPIQMISAPNFFVELSDERWEVIDPNSQDLWFQLSIDDNLGLRRYTPVAGSSISVIFQRADAFQTAGVGLARLQSETRTITKNGIADSNDRSLWKVSMTSLDIEGILSGTVKFTLTESGSAKTWVQNYFIKKNITDPGF